MATMQPQHDGDQDNDHEDQWDDDDDDDDDDDGNGNENGRTEREELQRRVEAAVAGRRGGWGVGYRVAPFFPSPRNVVSLLLRLARPAPCDVLYGTGVSALLFALLFALLSGLS
jgi:hypothetical protein